MTSIVEKFGMFGWTVEPIVTCSISTSTPASRRNSNYLEILLRVSRSKLCINHSFTLCFYYKKRVCSTFSYLWNIVFISISDLKNVSDTVKRQTNATIAWYFGRMMVNVIHYTQEAHVQKVNKRNQNQNYNR